MSLDVRCIVCGKREMVSDRHPQYERLQSSPKPIYLCVTCRAKVQSEADEKRRNPRPI